MAARTTVRDHAGLARMQPLRARATIGRADVAGLRPATRSVRTGTAGALILRVPCSLGGLRIGSVRLTLDPAAARRVRLFWAMAGLAATVALGSAVSVLRSTVADLQTIAAGRPLSGAGWLFSVAAGVGLAGVAVVVRFRPAYLPRYDGRAGVVRVEDLDPDAAREWADLNPGRITVTERSGPRP